MRTVCSWIDGQRAWSIAPHASHRHQEHKRTRHGEHVQWEDGAMAQGPRFDPCRFRAHCKLRAGATPSVLASCACRGPRRDLRVLPSALLCVACGMERGSLESVEHGRGVMDCWLARWKARLCEAGVTAWCVWKGTSVFWRSAGWCGFWCGASSSLWPSPLCAVVSLPSLVMRRRRR